MVAYIIISVQHLDYIIIHCVQEPRHFRETRLQATDVTTMQELSIANLQNIKHMEVKTWYAHIFQCASSSGAVMLNSCAKPISVSI